MTLQMQVKPKVVKFIQTLPPKHKRQLKDRVLSLLDNPVPQDAKKLVGYENYQRIDVGEYRVIYRYDVTQQIITVVLAGKRNDDDIYRIAKRQL